MSTSEYLLNFALLAFVLYSNLGTKVSTRRRLIRPLLIAAGIAVTFLGSIPGAGNDHQLEAAGLLLGAALGAVSALLVRVRRTTAGVVTTAGVGFAALWIVTVLGRVTFSYGSDHWFPQAIVNFSRTNQITSSAAWTAAFVLMAVAMVIVRTLITGAQVARLQSHALAA